ncbi:prostatic acid phosphatase-like [Acropora millepora]|uniref:prostatic acid phosphatase-like n=1 Tax=Acropora millepora TaxID=45264 RepID=UPI001CF4C1BA|nr:prostatic acid phosphatase-like [Acropora millepora]
MADRSNVLLSSFGCLLWLLCTHTVSYGKPELRMANVVYRHGDRSPVSGFKTDIHMNFWPQGLGQLTQSGMMQEFILGQFLRDRYVDKLINSSYRFSEVYVRSSDRDRCIMSAQTQLNGLYPPHGKQVWRPNLDWQPVGVHVVPANEDYLLRPYDYNCPRLSEVLEMSKQEPEYVNTTKKYKDDLSYISLHAGGSYSLSNMYQVYDTLFCEKTHNLSLPDWATNGTIWEDMRNMNNFGLMWMFKGREKAKLTGGSLVGEFIKNMKAHLEPTSKKLYIYSAHDTTVVALLSALNLFDGIQPAYSSAVMVELYSDPEDHNKNLTVRILYRFGQSSKPRILKLPTCTVFCPLDQFIKKTAYVVPDNIDKACGVEEKCVRTLVYKSFLVAFAVVTAVLLLLVLLLCINFCRKRCCRPQRNLTIYNDLLKDARLLDKPDYDSDG